MQQKLPDPPAVILVPTPVGNLADMTYRSVEVLSRADLIAAEDTRKSGILLKHYGIETHMVSVHMHNEHKKVPELIARLQEQPAILAVISDAGTPGISDPGFLIAKAAIEAGITVQTLPGATAFVPALLDSGLAAHRFTFEGFLPQKKGRKTRLESLADEPRTMIFYESPHRLLRTLKDFAEIFGEDRRAAVVREISKLHEETHRGSVRELIEFFQKHDNKIKGEMVIVLAGREQAL